MFKARDNVHRELQPQENSSWRGGRGAQLCYTGNIAAAVLRFYTFELALWHCLFSSSWDCKDLTEPCESIWGERHINILTIKTKRHEFLELKHSCLKCCMALQWHIRLCCVRIYGRLLPKRNSPTCLKSLKNLCYSDVPKSEKSLDIIAIFMWWKL